MPASQPAGRSSRTFSLSLSLSRCLSLLASFQQRCDCSARPILCRDTRTQTHTRGFGSRKASALVLRHTNGLLGCSSEIVYNSYGRTHSVGGCVFGSRVAGFAFIYVISENQQSSPTSILALFGSLASHMVVAR